MGSNAKLLEKLKATLLEKDAAMLEDSSDVLSQSLRTNII